MYFYWDYVINGFLFENFNIDSLKKCLLVILVVFILAFVNQTLKTVQKIIEDRFTNWNTYSRVNSSDVNETSPLVQSLRIPISNDEIKKRRFYFF